MSASARTDPLTTALAQYRVSVGSEEEQFIQTWVEDLSSQVLRMRPNENGGLEVTGADGFKATITEGTREGTFIVSVGDVRPTLLTLQETQKLLEKERSLLPAVAIAEAQKRKALFEGGK